MRCFDPAQVPIITQLAKEFAVCDRWFSSLPSPTCFGEEWRIEVAENESASRGG